eukprot:scaffold289_cov144-Skeletonema_menzelii.AAC.8
MAKILVVTLHLWLMSTAVATSKSSFSPQRCSFVAPFTRPARLLGELAAQTTSSDESTTTPQQSMDVRELMQLLEKTYPSSHAPIDATNRANKNEKQKWARTRNYLYQYRANLSRSNSDSSSTKPAVKKRTRRNRDPLTIAHLKQIISFLENTFPNHPELQSHILQNTPRIISKHHSIESRLLPAVQFLKELYGDMAGSDGKKGSMFFEAIQRNSNLLLVQGVGYVGDGTTRSEDTTSVGGNSIGSKSVKVEEYLENVVGTQGIAKLKKTQPTLFQLSLGGKVQPAVEYLLSLLLGYVSPLESIPSKQKKLLTKIIINHNNLLQLDVDSNLKSTALFLRDYCDLTDSELGTVVGSNPSILGLAVDGNLLPKMQLLTNILAKGTEQDNSIAESDVTKTALRKSILKHPQILSLSTSNICTKMDYFDSIDVKSNTGKIGNTLAARLLSTAPSVYSLSLAENVIPKVNYLAALWGWHSLSSKLCECPLLTLSMDNIQQTLSFYNMTGYIDLPNEDGTGVSRENASNVRSRYIATSLYNRLLPRWNFLLQEQERKEQLLGVLAENNDDANRLETTKYHLPSSTTPRDKVLLPPLHLLAGASDEVFCRQLNLSLSEYSAFKEEAVPRLKFNSQFDRWLKTGRPIDMIAL